MDCGSDQRAIKGQTMLGCLSGDTLFQTAGLLNVLGRRLELERHSLPSHEICFPQEVRTGGLHSPWRPPKGCGGLWPWPRTFLETKLCQTHWLPGTAIPTAGGPYSCSAPPSSVGDQAWVEWAWECWRQPGNRGSGGESRDSCDHRGWGATA